MSTLQRGVLIAVVAVVATACWEQPGFDSGQTSSSSFATSISTATVGSLRSKWVFPTDGSIGAAVSRGNLYIAGAHLDVYDAGGCAGPAPATCGPTWRSESGSGFSAGPVIGDGKVWLVLGTKLVAYDAAGNSGCSGVPRTCAPIVTVDVPLSFPQRLLWASGHLFVTGVTQATTSFTGWLLAYDVSGHLAWKASLGTDGIVNGFSALAADASHVFAPMKNGHEGAFDITAGSRCSGAPTTCTPVWEYRSAGGIAVANGRAYVYRTDSVEAFDAEGRTACSGSPAVCDPIVRYDGGASALAVTSGVLYTAPTDGQRIDAFSMHDANHCTSGTPVVCSPTWTTAAHTDHTTYRRLTTAGGVLYASRARCVSSSCPAGTLLGGIEAFDAAGTVGCHGATVVCDPLLAMPTATVAAEVIVVGGIAYAVGEFSESPGNPAVTVGLGGP